jgi:hypothetical protein
MIYEVTEKNAIEFIYLSIMFQLNTYHAKKDKY